MSSLSLADWNEVYRDLEFFYQQLDSRIGFKSSFSSFQQRLGGVTPVAQEIDYTEAMLAHIHRGKLIRNTLLQLSPLYQQVLAITYDPPAHYPPSLVKYFKTKAGAALLTDYGPIAEETCRNKKHNQELFLQIQTATNRLYYLAHKSYLDLKHRRS